MSILYIYCQCRFEILLFKLEVLDHKARERAGVITPTLGSPIPVLLQLDAAIEVPNINMNAISSVAVPHIATPFPCHKMLLYFTKSIGIVLPGKINTSHIVLYQEFTVVSF